MRRIGYARIAILAGVILTGATRMAADDQQASIEQSRRRCSEATLRGDCGIQFQGTRPGPGGAIESVIGVAMRKYDGQGNFTQVGNTHGSISGTTLGQEGWGTYEVDANCTGIAYLQLQGAPFVIEERTVIVEERLGRAFDISQSSTRGGYRRPPKGPCLVRWGTWLESSG